MESVTFFPGANRRVTLGSPTKQCSNGRIVFAVQMPLTGESFASLPDWVGSGFEAVSKNFMEVNPEVQEVSDLALAFSNDAPKGELFAPPSGDNENRANPVARIGNDECAHDCGNGSTCAESRDFGIWVSRNLDEHGHKAADKVEEKVAAPAHAIFNCRTKGPQVDHVADDVQPTAVQEHGCEERDPMVAEDDPRGNGGPSVHEVAATGQLLEEDEGVRQD